MRALFWGIFLTLPLVLTAAPKAPAEAHASNEAVSVDARLFLGKEAVKQVLGSDLDGYYIVVEVHVRPQGKPVKVRRDDFLLRTDKDGERSTPFVASQIAGKGVLVVTQGSTGTGVVGEDQGPAWGGYPGGPMGRLPGQGGNIGNGPGGSAAEATLNSNNRSKESPLMKVLDDKILPEKETSDPVSGLLYFPMDIKQKVKDLEMYYTTPAGKISLRFH